MVETPVSNPLPSGAEADISMSSPMKGRLLQQLLYACRENNSMAHRDLYQRFYGYAMSIGLRYASTREDAEEIVNDSFVKAFRHLKEQYDGRSFKSWMRRILVNTAIDYHRKSRIYACDKSLEDVVDLPDSVDNLESLEEEELRRLIDRLSPAYQKVFTLYAIQGYKHHEIAKILDISVGTSKSNLARARRQLQQILIQLAYR